MLEPMTTKLKRQLEKKAGKINFCSKGGQHFAKSRADSARCQKCGMTVAEIKGQILSKVKEQYPEVEK